MVATQIRTLPVVCAIKLKMRQPCLFPDLVFTPNLTLQTANKIISHLYRIRHKLKPLLNQEPDFEDVLNQAINKVREYSRLTETQKQGLILYAIEKKQCWTVTDIAAETKLTEKEVRRISDDLVNLRFARYVQRYIPGGCYKKNYLIKSNRIYVPDND